MKPAFHHRLVNEGFEDPVLYVRLVREGRALLFDIGYIEGLTPRDLMKITDVFVTHPHMDHFIGFDTLLRAVLRRDVPLRLYGPENIIECVEGKLRGYAWNIIEEYPLKVEVFAIHDSDMHHASFYAGNGFKRIDRGAVSFDGTVLSETAFTVYAVRLSHGIPSIGYSLKEDFHINIDKAALQRKGLPVGPWLTIFKKMIRQRAGMDTSLTIDGRSFLLSELLPIATITEGQKISYITDIGPNEANIDLVTGLVRNSDTLYCEAFYLHKDITRARERHHLTARVAGEIARRAEVKRLVVMHFSSKYRDNRGLLEAEAMEGFKGQ